MAAVTLSRFCIAPVVWLLLFFAAKLCDSSADERRLYEDLKRGYNVLERPVENHSLPVTVYLKVSLQQLIDVDEKVQYK